MNLNRLTMTFKPASKSDWLEKIKSDLKSVPLEELDIQFGDISIPRFSHPEDQNIAPDPIKSKKRSNLWKPATFIELTDLTQAIRTIAKEFDGGTAVFNIILEKGIHVGLLSTLLEQIPVEDIEIHWKLTSTSELGNFLEWWTDYCASNALPIAHSLECGDHNQFILAGRKTYLFPSFTATELCANPATSVEGLTQCFYKIARHLEHRSMAQKEGEALSEQIRLTIPVGINLLWEISKLRAARIVSAHLASSFGISPELFRIDVHSAEELLSMNENDQKIAATIVAIVGAVAGAESIAIKIPQTDNIDKEYFQRRINRNISHILNYESGLALVKDPAAGSYFFEKMTEDMARSIWATLQHKVSLS